MQVQYVHVLSFPQGEAVHEGAGRAACWPSAALRGEGCAPGAQVCIRLHACTLSIQLIVKSSTSFSRCNASAPSQGHGTLGGGLDRSYHSDNAWSPTLPGE